jgi:predicted metal-dependent hydrolase
MTAGMLLIAAAVGAAPLAAVGWFKWRFRATRMNANADKLLADADARMRALDDDALVAEFAAPFGAGQSRATRRVRGLIDERRFAELHREWHELWPVMVNDDKLSLDRAIDLGAAIKVLAERHPAS